MARARTEPDHRLVGYDEDFVAWTEQQAALLRARSLDGLDVENLAEEIESMGRRDRREIESRLRVILHHLLKWRAQPELRGPSWRHTLEEQRRTTAKRLKESPSLGARLPELVGEAYADARRDAVRDSGLRPQSFPATPPFTVEQILDLDYLPAAADED